MAKKYYKNKKQFSNKVRIVLVFSLTLILSALFYIINLYESNKLLDYISKNIFYQTFSVFLTIGTFLSLFLPFTFRKELNDEKVKEISSKEIEDYIQKENERIKNGALL